MTQDIFEQKAEGRKLAKQYDSLSGVELTHIRNTDRTLYERLCEAKGIRHGYATDKDYQDRQTPERLVSVDEAKATSRFSKADVQRLLTQKSSGNADNLNNLSKDPEAYRLFKVAKQVYESLEPLPNQLDRKIRPSDPVVRNEPIPYQRPQPPEVSDKSENTSIGEVLGKKLNLPASTRVSFDTLSGLLEFVAASERAKTDTDAQIRREADRVAESLKAKA